jgi:hypothetical protein
MDKLRTPFFVAAVALIVLVFALEIGYGPLAGLLSGWVSDNAAPGLGVPYLALLDVLLVLTAALMGASMIIPKGPHARVQGIVTLVVALLVLIGSIILIFVALALLLFMIGLIASFFGAIVYAAIYGHFARGVAAGYLTVILVLKLAFAVCLVLAHQRFVTNKGLVLLVLTSLAATVVVTFLHGLVPGLLVSVTDAVAAIVVGILAAIWALILLIGSIPAILRAIRPPAAPSKALAAD